jgi:DNA-binding Xre family transcriptional regulator
MDDWRKSLKRAFSDTIGPASVGLDDVLAATRQISKFNRLSRHLQGLDTMAAAKKGVGPAELSALKDLRVSEIPPDRLNELCDRLLDDKG